MAWEEIDTPEVLLTARCKRCHRVAGKYWSDSGWQDQHRRSGWCTCNPWPVLPSGDELAALLARALRAPGGRGGARLKIRVD